MVPRVLRQGEVGRWAPHWCSGFGIVLGGETQPFPLSPFSHYDQTGSALLSSLATHLSYSSISWPSFFRVSSTLLSQLPPSGHSLDTTHSPSACLRDLWAALGRRLSWVESPFLDSAPTPGHHTIHTAPVSRTPDLMALTHCPVPRTSLPGCPSGTSGSSSHWPQHVFVLLSREGPLFRTRLGNVDSLSASFSSWSPSSVDRLVSTREF